MQVPVDDVETLILSHWHSDHSGGMLAFLSMRSAGARVCTVDLHPDRPDARGIAVPPTFDTVIGRLPDDPTFEQIECAGGRVRTSRDGHTIAGGTVYVSGEIPRVTPFEGGLLGGMRFREGHGWTSEPVRFRFVSRAFLSVCVDARLLVDSILWTSVMRRLTLLARG